MKSSLEAVLDKKIYGAAARYSENNNLQLHYGKKLATKVGIKQGDKILDMGCGTGELTLCIGEIIGKKGRVVGVDPDIERIHYAIQHNCNVNENVSFEIGDSSNEKKMFLQTAFHCLKPSGKIAIQSHEGYPEIALYVECLISKRQNALTDINDKKPIQFFMSKSEATSLIEEMGFEIISSDYDVGKQRYKTLDDFLSFLSASHYHSTNFSNSERKEFMARFGNGDGSVDLVDHTMYQIIARKNCRSC
ncbi:phosphoethanolamine N-methyltransferase 1-like [Xenia sp. Carnegie-2017]|uniref:phosphoethanolamine N-methyltransferase 1-like n=1 Tax=Xenia sp. Carnegie-2017 TaxID=2897299 RepID=UPI001F04FFE3|nr:phosphoethanolamine N-methyltransferase 1-like [Xenia sp. Carnegie-2017]